MKVPIIEDLIRDQYYDILGFFSFPTFQDTENASPSSHLHSLDLLLVAPSHWTKREKYSTVLNLRYHVNQLKRYHGNYFSMDRQQRVTLQYLRHYMYGFARHITYSHSRDFGTGYAQSIWEGQLYGGPAEWAGFGRYVRITPSELYLGWFSSYKTFEGEGLHWGEHEEGGG